MGYVLIDEAACEIVYGGPSTLDLSDHLIAVEIGEETETIDIRTWGFPRISDVGGGQDTITLALRWSPELYDLLVAKEGLTGDLTLNPFGNDPNNTGAFTAEVSFDVAPVGPLQVGEASEVDLVLAVHDGIAFA